MLYFDSHYYGPGRIASCVYRAFKLRTGPGAYVLLACVKIVFDFV